MSLKYEPASEPLHISVEWAGVSPDENEVEDRSNCAVCEEVVHLVQNVLHAPVFS